MGGEGRLEYRRLRRTILYVEGMHVGTVAAGRIGLAVLRRLKSFDMHLHYYDRHRLPDSVEKELNLTWHPGVEDMVSVCDVVTINATASS